MFNLIQGNKQESYFLQHYQTQYGPYLLDQVPNLSEDFYQYILKLVKKYAKAGDNVIDVGCGMGRILFELAKDMPKLGKLTGVDKGVRYIDECYLIAHDQSPVIRFPRKEAFEKIEFLLRDATKLPWKDNSYEMVLCLNLVDRVPSPIKVAEEMYRITNKNGYLIASTPYDWLDEFTPQENRISSMHEIFPKDKWKVVLDKDIPYIVYANPRKFVSYQNHVLVLKKL